jgi:N-acylneuraminate cytidylyltransferase
MKIAIIPARAGSKRIPNKNIKHFSGKPIIAHVIERLSESKFFDRIVVSTDSEKIAKISRELGAEVPFIRPKNLADDFTGTIEVINHAIEELKLGMNDVNYVCCVYPTSVLLNTNELEHAFKLLLTNKWRFVFAATEPNSSPLRSFTQNKIGGVKMLFPENWGNRSQDLPKCYVDSGFFYWAKSNDWLNNEPIFDESSTFIEIPQFRAIDINTDADWKWAENVFNSMKD